MSLPFARTPFFPRVAHQSWYVPMNVVRSRTFAFMLLTAGVGAAAGCSGDDAPANEAAAPEVSVISVEEAFADGAHTISVAVENADEVELSWSVSSETLDLKAPRR